VATGESELSTDTDSIHNDSFSDLVHGASDSADNPRVAVSITHCFTDERYDNCSTRGDGDRGACVSSDSASEAEARVQPYNFPLSITVLYVIIYQCP
jgi:hypothetical protein